MKENKAIIQSSYRPSAIARSGYDIILAQFNNLVILLSIICLLGFVFSGCNRSQYIEDSSAKLSFSDDTLTYDTVFTTIGSATDGFLVYNEHNKTIRIEEIALATGSQSYFRMNIDGTPTTKMTNVEIPPNDSIYVFIDVNIDPSTDALPFIIKDSVTFMTNGNFQDVKLEAWGQNAHFHKNDTIQGMENWVDDLPHVVYGPVYVPESATLALSEGVNVYCHPTGSFVVKGRFEVNGTVDSLVSFDGDRPEEYFADLPAQWLGIYYLRGDNNSTSGHIRNAVIDNTLNGISVGDLLIPNQLYDTGCPTTTLDEIPLCYSASNAPSCTIENTIVKNAYAYGIIAMSAVVEGTNNLLYACGIHDLAILAGGIYNFDHCTFASYGSSDLSHSDPLLLALNTLVVDQDTILLSNLELNISNSIIMGSAEDELACYLNDDNPLVAINFDHCLIKTAADQALDSFVECLFNPLAQDSTFKSPYDKDFKLSSLSKAIDAGISSSSNADIDGNSYINAPDMGCYEYGY